MGLSSRECLVPDCRCSNLATFPCSKFENDTKTPRYFDFDDEMVENARAPATPGSIGVRYTKGSATEWGDWSSEPDRDDDGPCV